MIRILIVDDHQLVREALSSVLSRESDILVAGMTGDGETAVNLCAELHPDLVLMDIALTDISGIAATRRIVSANPSIKVLALSTYMERNVVESILEAGASGYINKGAGGSELMAGIREVLRGTTYLSKNVAELFENEPPDTLSRNSGHRLGKRETEVLKLVVEGCSSAQIAATMSIALGTVEVHRRNIMHKLDLHSVAELTKYAIREGLINP